MGLVDDPFGALCPRRCSRQYARNLRPVQGRPKRGVVSPRALSAVGFVYLAAILDAWSRCVIGYAIAGPPKGSIHHSIPARNMLPRTTEPNSRSKASGDRWGDAASRLSFV
jgi:hypothetical protein